MTRTSLCAAFAALAISFAPQLQADESAPPVAATSKVRLSNKEFKLPPKSKWREERIMSAPRLKLLVELGGDKELEGSMSMLSRQLIEVDVLSEKDVRLDFVQCESTNDIDFVNTRGKHATDLPLDGKTVLATRTSKGRWVAKLDGRRKPSSEESSALYALSYLWGENIYPDREMEIGQSWKVDAGEFRNLFGSDFERPQGEFDFTLARLVEHEGSDCVKITGKGKFTSRTKGLGAATGEETPLTATMDLTFEIYRSIDLDMDLTVNMNGTLDISNDEDADGLRYSATSPVEFSRTFRKR